MGSDILHLSSRLGTFMQFLYHFRFNLSNCLRGLRRLLEQFRLLIITHYLIATCIWRPWYLYRWCHDRNADWVTLSATVNYGRLLCRIDTYSNTGHRLEDGETLLRERARSSTWYRGERLLELGILIRCDLT